jgi:hypothetical protein
MNSAIALRRELSVRGQQIAAATGSVRELTPGEMPSVIFGRAENRRHGNFHPASYRKRRARTCRARRPSGGQSTFGDVDGGPHPGSPNLSEESR